MLLIKFLDSFPALSDTSSIGSFPSQFSAEGSPFQIAMKKTRLAEVTPDGETDGLKAVLISYVSKYSGMDKI